MTTRDVTEFSDFLNAQGPSAALAFLNRGVPHRYSAIYRLSKGMFENVYLHDKRGEVIPAFLAAVPFTDSFCQFVLRDTPFSAPDTAADKRLDGHRYQGVVTSYHGVPIVDHDGEIMGTLCHFDIEQHDLADSEFILLQKAALALPPFVARSGDRSAVAG